MFNINWQSSFTFNNRYEEDGVIDRVLEYVRETGRKSIVIMDVGCSSGIALKYLRFIIEGNGIEVIKTIGVDPSKKIKSEAEKNLDELIPQDIMKVNDELDKADIIICCKMVLWVQPKHRVQVLSKCSRFLKKDGALITDADKYEKEDDKEEFITWCREYWKTIYSLRRGIIHFIREIKETEKIRHKRMMFLTIGRENVNNYALEVLHGWEKRNRFEKYQIHRRNFFKRIVGHFQSKPIKKKRKKQHLL